MALFGRKDPYETETEGEAIQPPSKPAVRIPTRQPVPSTPSSSPITKPSSSGGFTTIGKGITIKGDLVGDEDVKIEGKVEGRVQLTQNLMVGQSGVVEADVQAENINIGGTVTGNLMAKNKVEIVASGTMMGDIKAPKVIVAEGAHFKGNVDMG